MDIFAKYWPRFKQELISILFLSVIQLWLSLNFPPFVRLGKPLSTIVSLGLSIIYILIHIFIFTRIDIFAPYFNLDYLDYLDEAPEPYGIILKNIYKALLILVSIITIFVLWYKDYYGMSNTWYALLYTYWIIAFSLIFRAAHRYKNSKARTA